MHRQGNQKETLATRQPPSLSQTESARQSCMYQGVQKKEMERNMQKSSEEDENDDIAVKSVLEMGYAKSAVQSVVDILRKEGKSKYTAMDIMAIILDQEERQTTVLSTTTLASAHETTSASIPSDASVQPKASLASTDSLSLMRENQTLKEQMLCKICLDKDASMVYLPCGHMVTCQDCAPTIRKCCICRKMILGTVKAYL